jgi:hypothetical protein
MQVPKDYHYTKLSGFADMRGGKFEVSTIAMLFCRALNTRHDFFLASNMDAVPGFDDIVLKLEEQPIFIQLKHKRNKAKLQISQLLQLNGDFSVLKLCSAYFQLKKNWSEKQNLQFYGSFENALFILYTNMTCPDVPEFSDSSTDWQHVLDSGGSYFPFNENSHPEIYRMFENLPRYKELLTAALDKQTCEEEKELLEAVQQLLNNSAKTLPIKDELKKLLEDLESLGDLSEYKKFLSRFWLFTGQASEDNMKKFIQYEITKALGTENMYRHFYDKIEKWFQKLKTAPFLKKTSKLWQDIISNCTGNINKQTLTQIHMPDVRFCDDEVRSIKAKLLSSDRLLCIVSSSTALSCMKVHQSLVDVRHMLVNSSTMSAHKGEVLALLDQGCNILVVVCDDSVDMTCLTGHLLESSVKKWILVAENVVLNESEYTFSILNDQVGFMHLDTASRNQLLSVIVQFQGHSVPFREVISSEQNLQDTLHGDAIIQLKDKVILGKPLMDDIDYYEPLNLQRADYIQEILPGQTTVVPVTALQEQTLEKMEILRQDPDDDLFENIDSIKEVPCRLVLISSEPGTGKSTLLTHVAVHTKQSEPATWVISVKLKDCSKALVKLPTNPEISHVENFLLEVSGIKAAFKPLFRKRLESMENVCVLFDGVDEVSPDHMDKVTLFLQRLLETKLKYLWITT